MAKSSTKTRVTRRGGHWVREGRTGRRILRLPPGTTQYFTTLRRVEWRLPE